MYSETHREIYGETLAAPNLYALQALNENSAEPHNPFTISVVIAWVNSYELLTAGLDALLIQEKRTADEIIVVTRHGENEQRKLQENYPNVILVSAAADTTITKLRSLGVRLSTGSAVAVTEDHCVPARNWLATIERKISDGGDVVGGAIENAWDKRLRDEAAFLTEYAFAIRAAGETKSEKNAAIPGNNAAYRRELIEGLCETLDADLWESFYFDELRDAGKNLVCDAEMLLYHRRPFDFFYFVRQRFHFCRSFAEMRASQSLNNFGRAKYGAGSLILPPLLWLRGLNILRKKRRMVGRYFLCSPLIWVYLCAGAIGEMTGYFFGAGKSLARVE